MADSKIENRGSVFSHNLTMLRQSRGMTQLEVAKLLSINRSTYTKYETGVSEPSITTIRKIAKLFSVDANALIEEKDVEYLSEQGIWQFPLSKREQDLISAFRKLDPPGQKRILSMAGRLLNTNENKENKE